LTPANASITTWRVFKEDVAVFIVHKVCKGFQDPFTNQRKYIRGRKLCHGLKVREQYERVQFANNCLPMLLTRETMEAKSQGAARSFTDLWQWGQLQAHDMPEVIGNMIPEAWRQTYNVLAGGRELDSEEMIRLLTTIECNPKFAGGLGDNRRLPSQWRGGQRQPFGRTERNYVRGRAPIKNYYPSNNPGSYYRPRDERTQRFEAPLARETYTHGQQQPQQRRFSPRFQRGGQPAPPQRGTGRFGIGRGAYHGQGRFDRSAHPSREQYHHLDETTSPHAAEEHFAQPSEMFYDAQQSVEEEEEYYQDDRQAQWEAETWRRFEQEQQELEGQEDYPPDDQFLAEEDEWHHLPSEDEYNEQYEYDEGQYL